MAPFTFVVPPSMGGARVQDAARTLEDALRAAGIDVAVSVAADYQEIIRALEHSQALAAWGPPMVCAWAEAFGGRALARSVREGHGTYRAAIVRRRGEPGGIDVPGLKAAWVDRDSMAGYVLAQALVREHGFRPSRHFSAVSFVGSFRAALDALLAGAADVTSVWASCADAIPPRDGVHALAGERAGELEIVAYTRECPNDGIVAARGLAPEIQQRLQDALLGLATRGAVNVLREVFQAERLEVPPAGTYGALHGTVFKALTG